MKYIVNGRRTRETHTKTDNTLNRKSCKRSSAWALRR